MGLYDDPYSLYGRLAMDIFLSTRGGGEGSRAVGIFWLNWTAAKQSIQVPEQPCASAGATTITCGNSSKILASFLASFWH